MATRRIGIWAGVLLLVGLSLAIGATGKAGSTATLVLPPYDVGEPDYSPELSASSVDIGTGEKLFAQSCTRCHGLQGDGKGPVAYLLSPSPRDFTRGIYKIRSTPSGQLPADRDLFRAITLGMPGSGMPAWKDKLSQQERWQLVYSLRHPSPTRATSSRPRSWLRSCSRSIKSPSIPPKPRSRTPRWSASGPRVSMFT